MDNSDRERIKENIQNLIRFTRYGELMDLCIKEKLLFPVMKEEIDVSTNYKTMLLRNLKDENFVKPGLFLLQ